MNTNGNAAELQSAALTMEIKTFRRKTHHTTNSAALDLDLLLSKVNLEELAERAGTELHRSGNELRGICPLHKGDNATAFSVYTGEDGRERWRCYTGCNTGGDAIDFVQSWRGLDFMGAVKFLAEYAAVDLEQLGFTPDAIKTEHEHRKVADIMDAAAQFFKSNLWGPQGEPARTYLLKRGFTEKTLRDANWGCSQTDQTLLQHLEESKADLSLARELGLLRTDGLDFTANANGRNASPSGYIVYPHIWNLRCNYFSARALKPIDPEDKSRNLPGERQVYWALTPDDLNLIIVEGQADAESLRQAGRSAMALCGVGNLPEHEIERVHKRRTIYLALDNDLLKSGLADVEKSKIQKRKADTTRRLCETLGALVMVAPDLPHKDFNEWLQQGLTLQGLDAHLKQSRSWLDILIEAGRSIPPSELDDHLQTIAGYVRQLPQSLQSYYGKQIEKSFSLGSRDVRQLIQQIETADMQIYSEIKDQRLHFMGEPLGNFWARIKHELMVDDGLNSPTVRYSIEGGLAAGKSLPEIQVDARAFSKMDWIPGGWGMRPIINLPPGKAYLMARAIQEVSMETVRRERLYTFTGWINNEGQKSFLSASGLLTATGMKDQARIDLGSNNLLHYALPKEQKDLAAGVQASLDFLALGPRTVTAPIWAAMYAAPLTSLRSLNAVLAVYGTTQSGKSTLAHLALTHFGSGFIQGRDYHAPIDWTSTVTSLEAAMFLAKDVPLVIDDFAPQFSSVNDARSMHKKAEYVVRSVGNRSARGRSRSDLSQQVTRFPRGLVIMTSENPLVGQSIVGRMLYVGVEPDDILPKGGGQDRLSGLQAKAQQGLLSQAMAAYIQYLAGNWERIAAEFPAMVDRAAQSVRQSGNLQNRLPDAYAVLAAAQEVALRCFEELKFITTADVDKLIEQNNAALLEIIQSQAEQVAAESPVRKFFIAISSLLEQQKVYFAPRTKVIDFFPPKNADLIGYYEPGSEQKVVYLRTEACLSSAKEFWRALDQNLDSMPDALRRQLSQVPGLLARVGERQVEVTKFCNGANQKVLEVSCSQVEKLYGVSISNIDAQ